MSKALVKRGGNKLANGAVPGVAGLLIPGLGQVINGQGDKAIGMFAVWGAALGVAWVGLPLLGPLAGLAAGAMHVVSGVDGLLSARKKK